MARKSAVVEEVEDLELELDEDDVDEDEDEDEAPVKAKKKKAKAPAAVKPDSNGGYGIGWLVEHVSDTLDVETTPAALRVLLRKLAADGSIDREVGEDRTRYTFTGEGDKTVKLVIKAVRGGALTKAKSDNLAAARAAKLAKKENAGPPAKANKKKSKAKVAEDDDDAAPVKATRRRRSA